MRLAASALAASLLASTATAQSHMHSVKTDSTSARAPAHDMSHMGHGMPGMDMSGMEPTEHAMHGLYGAYPTTREASGTAWQPDHSLHAGIHGMRGPWMTMLHGTADVVRTAQGGPRGGDKVFSANMLMATAQRPLGPGTLGVRAMLSAEPATIGKSGYPLLLQTGETADGEMPLVDRQHPHDLFMELAGTYAVARGDRSWFLYAGLPGEPALGPPAFMHRLAAAALPEAPIGHHWLDSTHITYGVLTAGAVADRYKVEVSAFRGREPDQDRWNLETPKLDSQSLRLSFNPSPAWALQASAGRLHSPEQLEPDVNTDRTTVSAMYAHPWQSGRWEGMLAWGRNRNRPGLILDEFSAEAAVHLEERHTLFGRWERTEKDELFSRTDPRAGRAWTVSKASIGYRWDFLRQEHLVTGLGVAGTLSHLPFEASDAYGGDQGSGLLFLQLALR